MINPIRFEVRVPAIGTAASHSAALGSSVADMARIAGGGQLSAYLRANERGLWHPLEEKSWHRIKPKGDDCIVFMRRMQFDPTTIGIALSSIFSAVSSAFASVAGLLGLTSSQLLLGVGLTAGSYLAQRLFAPERQRNTKISDDGKKAAVVAADSDSNLLARDSYLPRVFGTRRISPPDIMNPHLYLDAGVETIERLCALSGPHVIEDVKVDGTLVDDMPTITYETRDGADGTTTNTFVTRYCSPVNVSDELSNFSLDGVDLEDQSTPNNSSPVAIRFTTKGIKGLAEVAIRLRIDLLLNVNSTTTKVRCPVRLRYRPQYGDDTTWINLPEIHLVGVEQGSRYVDIRVRRDNGFGAEDIGGSISYEFFREVPAAANTLNGASGTQWEADAAFSFGSGYMDSQNVIGRRHGVRVTAVGGIFEEQDYEWEMVRGIAITASSLSSSYTVSGSVVGLFNAYNAGTGSTPIWRVPVDQTDFQCRISIASANAIAEVHPCQQPGTALVALKARGQSIRNVTAKATGKVKDWDGSGWNTWTTSDNPALHARQLLEDFCRYSRVAEYSRIRRFRDMAQSLLVDADWLGWKAQCEAMGARVSMVATGDAVEDVLQALLAAGLARPAFGPKLRIDYFRDRSAELPLLTFSPRNSKIRLHYQRPSLPMGTRATFQNRLKEWQDDELEVRAPITGNTPNWDKVDIQAIDDPTWLEQRVTFDMLRARYWSTVYEVETFMEGQALTRGDMVGIVTDLVDDRAHGVRVMKTLRADVLEVDQILPAENTIASLDDITSSLAFEDLFEVGEQSTCIMTTPTGSELRTIVDFYRDAQSGRGTIILDTPFSSTDLNGAHFTIGCLSNSIRRCIVVDETPGDDLAKTVMCADEAPQIYDYMKSKFGWADV